MKKLAILLFFLLVAVVGNAYALNISISFNQIKDDLTEKAYIVSLTNNEPNTISIKPTAIVDNLSLLSYNIDDIRIYRQKTINTTETRQVCEVIDSGTNETEPEIVCNETEVNVTRKVWEQIPTEMGYPNNEVTIYDENNNPMQISLRAEAVSIYAYSIEPNQTKTYKVYFHINKSIPYLEGMLAFGDNITQTFKHPVWNNSWKYYREVILTNPNARDLTDFQVNITIDTQTLIAEGKMNQDCSDIRIIDEDGTTSLPYWITDRTCNTSSTKIWIKVPFIPANSSKIIYIYYGNPNAISESNIHNVFEYADDFNAPTLNETLWTPILSEHSGATYSLQDGYIRLDDGSTHNEWANAGIQLNGFSTSEPFVVETSVRFTIRYENSILKMCRGDYQECVYYGLDGYQSHSKISRRYKADGSESRLKSDYEANTTSFTLLRVDLYSPSETSINSANYYVEDDLWNSITAGTIDSISIIQLIASSYYYSNQIFDIDYFFIRKYAPLELSSNISCERGTNHKPHIVNLTGDYNTLTEPSYPTNQNLIYVYLGDEDNDYISGYADIHKIVVNVNDGTNYTTFYSSIPYYLNRTYGIYSTEREWLYTGNYTANIWVYDKAGNIDYHKENISIRMADPCYYLASPIHLSCHNALYYSVSLSDIVANELKFNFLDTTLDDEAGEVLSDYPTHLSFIIDGTTYYNFSIINGGNIFHAKLPSGNHKVVIRVDNESHTRYGEILEFYYTINQTWNKTEDIEVGEQVGYDIDGVGYGYMGDTSHLNSFNWISATPIYLQEMIDEMGRYGKFIISDEKLDRNITFKVIAGKNESNILHAEFSNVRLNVSKYIDTSKWNITYSSESLGGNVITFDISYSNGQDVLKEITLKAEEQEPIKTTKLECIQAGTQHICKYNIRVKDDIVSRLPIILYINKSDLEGISEISSYSINGTSKNTLLTDYLDKDKLRATGIDLTDTEDIPQEFLDTSIYKLVVFGNFSNSSLHEGDYLLQIIYDEGESEVEQHHERIKKKVLPQKETPQEIQEKQEIPVMSFLSNIRAVSTTSLIIYSTILAGIVGLGLYLKVK